MGSTEDEVHQAFQLCKKYYADCKPEMFEREEPTQNVALEAFWLDRTEISNGQYRRCVEAGVCPASLYDGEADFSGDSQPVVGVSWNDAAAYCKSVGARLPTEAEWEYAARGPDRRTWPWGDVFDGTRLNYCDVSCEHPWADKSFSDGHPKTSPVGSYPDGASWCTALDLAGNVWEWVEDWYGSHLAIPQSNPTRSASDDFRVLRGGAWDGQPYDARGATRHMDQPDPRNSDIGFRCAKSAEARALAAVTADVASLTMPISPPTAMPTYTTPSTSAEPAAPVPTATWTLPLSHPATSETTATLAVQATYSSSLPPNEQLTSDAWAVLNRLDYAVAIQKTEECIDSFELQAIRDQEALKDSPMPPVGAVSDEDKAVIQARGVLNDVATCYFIKGQALEKLGRVNQAKEAYQSAKQFPHARTWDPLGFFWSPAQAASDRLAKLSK